VRGLVAATAAAIVLLSAGRGLAADAPAISPDAIARARDHYEHAKALYRAGQYREAIAEIEAARALDPYAKQLVFNLALLHEKLGEIDLALAFVRQFLKMDLLPDEREKAEVAVRRLEGERHEGAPAPPPATTAAPPPPASAAPPPSAAPPSAAPPENDDASAAPEEAEAPRSHGRLDALTAGAALLAVAGAGFGIYFGLRATSDRPSGFVTGVDGTFADLQSRTDTAHREAIEADVAFGVGALAAVGAALLYFGRTDAAPAKATSGLVVGPLRDGGAVFLRGDF
jgi:tetratricopeptide (TPR) repeat protein